MPMILRGENVYQIVENAVFISAVMSVASVVGVTAARPVYLGGMQENFWKG